MKLPLMITETSGDVLYVDPSVTVGGALRLFASTVAKESSRSTVYFDGLRVFTKEVSLNGKRFRFFCDAQTVCSLLGVEESTLDDKAFDVPKAFHTREALSLKSFITFFSSKHIKRLMSDGINVLLGTVIEEDTVNVSPNALALCISIAVRLAAQSANEVSISLSKECGRTAVHVCSTSGTTVEATAAKLLEALLYEVGASAGFKIEEIARGEKRAFSIHLDPLDTALIGFKAPAIDKALKIAKIYVEIFL